MRCGIFWFARRDFSERGNSSQTQPSLAQQSFVLCRARLLHCFFRMHMWCKKTGAFWDKIVLLFSGRVCFIVYLGAQMSRHVRLNKWKQFCTTSQSTTLVCFPMFHINLELLVLILAEGAIALLVTLSGSALFASWKLLQFPSRLIVKVIRAIFKRASAQSTQASFPLGMVGKGVPQELGNIQLNLDMFGQVLLGKYFD